MALPVLLLTGLALGAFGLFLSSLIRQIENFAGVMNFVIFPLFFLSSAVYPLWKMQESSLIVYWLCAVNPFTHIVELIRFSLYLRPNPLTLAVTFGTLLAFAALAILSFDPQRGLVWRLTS